MPILGIMASQISGHLWQPDGAYDSLATVTVGAGGVASITFAGIPNTYKHLQIRGIAFNSSDVGLLRFNGNSTSGNYVEHGLRGDGSSASAYAQTSSRTAIQMGTAVATSTSPYTFVIEILDYQSTTKNKTVRMLLGYDANGSGQMNLISGLFFPSTIEAINSLSITAASSVWAVNSQFSLYGVK
jgi:hypothetical protein